MTEKSQSPLLLP